MRMGIGRRRVGNHTANRLNRIAAICQCVRPSGRILARRTMPALTTTRSQKRDTQCSPTVLGHLLHSFIYNLITDGVGIASLWWMNGQPDSWTPGQMESSCSLARHWGHTVRRKSLCPACQPASLPASFGETLYGPLEMQFLPLSFLSYFCGLYGVCQIEGHNSQFN